MLDLCFAGSFLPRSLARLSPFILINDLRPSEAPETWSFSRTPTGQIFYPISGCVSAKIAPARKPAISSWMRVSGDVPFQEVGFCVMKHLRQITKTNDPSRPIWCARCYVRIAPSERHATKSGKTYHQACYAKLHNRSTAD